MSVRAVVVSIDERTEFFNLLFAYIKDFTPEDRVEYITKGKVKIEKFANKEISVQFENTLRDKYVFLVSTLTDSDSIIKLCLACNAAKIAKAAHVIPVIPHYAYARQDSKEGIRGCIGAQVIAMMLEAAGATRAILLELHAKQLPGFFRIPVDHVNGFYIFKKYFEKFVLDFGKKSKISISSPDANGMVRAMKFFNFVSEKHSHLDITTSFFNKRRIKPNEIESMVLVGEVKDRHVILIDDMIDTAGSVIKAADLAMENGALSVSVFTSHGIFSANAIDKLKDSCINKIMYSDSLGHTMQYDKFIPVTCTRSMARVITSSVFGYSADRALDRD